MPAGCSVLGTGWDGDSPTGLSEWFQECCGYGNWGATHTVPCRGAAAPQCHGAGMRPPRLLPSLRRERGLCAVAAPSGAGVSLPWHERAFQEGLRPGSASGNRSRGGPPAAGRTMPVCARHLGGTRWHCTSAGCERGGGAHPIPGAPQNAAAPRVPLGSPLHGCSVWCPRARIEEHPKWVHHWGAEAQIKESTPVSGCAVLLQEAGGWHQGAGTQPAARPQGVQQTHPLRHRLPGVPRWPGGSPLLPAHPQEASDG